MARPERFELPTARFVAEYSIQLSYGRIVCLISRYSASETLLWRSTPVSSPSARISCMPYSHWAADYKEAVTVWLRKPLARTVAVVTKQNTFDFRF